MTTKKEKKCPICGFHNNIQKKPIKVTKFNNQLFNYIKCKQCSTVFVDPIPSNLTFAKMYEKSSYHDSGYNGEIDETYGNSVKLLEKYANKNSRVLDYGCGLGYFLKELENSGFIPFGVEFDKSASDFASEHANCNVWTVEYFSNSLSNQSFDVVHLGDVLEHVPDPSYTVDNLLKRLNPGGILFVEGPLELNPSPVYWAIKIFSKLKGVLKSEIIDNNPPHHLFHTKSNQQLNFFLKNIKTPLELSYWNVYESGWPYINGGIIKKFIAKIAIGTSRIGNLFGMSFGNRFQAIFIKK